MTEQPPCGGSPQRRAVPPVALARSAASRCRLGSWSSSSPSTRPNQRYPGLSGPATPTRVLPRITGRFRLLHPPPQSDAAARVSRLLVLSESTADAAARIRHLADTAPVQAAQSSTLQQPAPTHGKRSAERRVGKEGG